MKKYIPTSKDDIDAISVLKAQSFNEIKSDASKLLEFMQDMHWDVAHGIADYFVPYVNELKEELIYILNTNDNEWKHGILVFLIARYQKPLDKDFLNRELLKNPPVEKSQRNSI